MQAATSASEIALHPWLAPFASLAERSPIAVRQLRQQLRGRTWSVALVVLPALCAIAALACLVWADRHETWQSFFSPPRLLFGGYLLVWGVICGAVQPGAAGRALRRERLDQTWDLIELTGMGGQAIAFGHWCAAAVQIALMSALFAPFLVMAWLLRGVDTGSLLLALVGVPAWGLLVAAFAVLGATAPPPKKKINNRVQVGAEILGLLFGWPLYVGVMQPDGASRMLSGLGGGALALALAASGWVLVVTGCLVQAGTALTHLARNRSTAPRLVSCITAVLVAVWAFLLAPFASHGLATAAVLILVIALWTGLGAMAEFDGTTSRQQRWLDEARGFWRRTAWFLGPGCRRGRRCVLLLVGLGLVCAAASGQASVLRGCIAIVAYAFLCFLLADAIARRTAKNGVHRPRWQSTLTVFTAFGLHIIGILLIWMTDSRTDELLYLLPVAAISALFAGKAQTGLTIGVTVLSVICTAIVVIQACGREHRLIRIVGDDAPER